MNCYPLLPFPARYKGFPDGSAGKESACNAERPVRCLGQEDPLEEEMVAHCSILVWRIPWTEEPGGLYMGSQRVRTQLNDLACQLVTYSLYGKVNFSFSLVL